MQPNNQNLSNQYPGIRLYVEDPQVAIKRQIKRTIIIVISIVIIGSALVFYSVSSIKKANVALGGKEKLIGAATQAESLDSNVAENLQTLPSLDTLKNALPTSTDLLGYQSALEQAAKNAGVKIAVTFSGQQASEGTSTGTSSNTSKFPSVAFTVTADGGIADIISFISSIENMPYFVQIVNLKISSSQTQEKASSATLSLKIFTNPQTSTANKPQNLPSSL